MADDLAIVIARALEDEYGNDWTTYMAVSKAIVMKLRRNGSYAVVPVEPTEAMLIAARDWSREKYGIPIGDDAAKGAWAAMLSAAALAGRE